MSSDGSELVYVTLKCHQMGWFLTSLCNFEMSSDGSKLVYVTSKCHQMCSELVYVTLKCHQMVLN